MLRTFAERVVAVDQKVKEHRPEMFQVINHRSDDRRRPRHTAFLLHAAALLLEGTPSAM